MIKKNFILLFVLFLTFQCNESDVKKSAIPEYVKPSTVYSLEINGQQIPVQEYKDIHYAHFIIEKNCHVNVTLNEKIGKVNLSPHRLKIPYKTDKNTLTFQLNNPAYLVLQLNDQERLFLFADEPLEMPENAINVLDLGVVNNPDKVQTESIQQALNGAANQQKVLFFPPGIYTTGTLSIPSTSSIFMAEGAMIKGSPNREEYPVDDGWTESDSKYDPENWTNQGHRMTYSRLLLIDDAENVTIDGHGIIDGSGRIIRGDGKPANLIRIRNSKNVTLQNVFLRDPAAWNTHILHSENVICKNLKMINDPEVENTDGFDPDASKYVKIINCFMYCSDDNIAIKSSGNSNLIQDCEDILVQDCVMLTRKSALKLGTETRAKYQRNIRFIHNDIIQCDRGISLYNRDGAIFKNVQFIDNHFEEFYRDNGRRCIDITISKRFGIGKIQNVLIKDCTFEKANERFSRIHGYDDQHLAEDFIIENFKLVGKTCKTLEEAQICTNQFVKNISIK